MNKILAAALGAGCAATAVLAPVSADAAQDVKTVATTVHLRDGFTTDPDTGDIVIRGSVDSPRAICSTGRKVILRQLDQDVRAGSDRTNDEGRWRVAFDGDDVHPGRFRAIAPAVRVGDVRCARDTATRTIDGGAS